MPSSAQVYKYWLHEEHIQSIRKVQLLSHFTDEDKEA